jgi:hypothetical protein
MVSNLSFYFYVFQLLTKNLHVADLVDLLVTPLQAKLNHRIGKYIEVDVLALLELF